MRSLVTAVLFGGVAGGVVPLHGEAQQDVPPEPLPMEALAFPEVVETRLSSGAEVMLVSSHEQPWVTVNLVIRSGSAADPPERAGLAEMTSELLLRGAGTRTGPEIAEEVDFLGAELSSSVSPDWTTLSLGILSHDLERGLEILADVALDPTFPDEEVQRQRSRVLSNLQAEAGQAGFLARRAFLPAVYGEHPYGAIRTPETVRRIDGEAVRGFHRRHFGPENALFVVAGDVEEEEVVELLEAHFGGWEGGAGVELDVPQVPRRERPEVILVHRPETRRAVMRLGHAVIPGRAEGWPALEVANQLLGGGPGARLVRELRDRRGWAYSASSEVARRPSVGHFQAGMEVRPEAVDSALTGLLAEIRRLQDEMPPPEELADFRDFLVGSFPLRIETPQQVASQLARFRLLGLGREDLEGHRSRIADVGPQEARDAARDHLRPERSVVVVVGDARRLHSALSPFGDLRIVDEEWRPVAVADLAEPEEASDFDASLLEPGRWSYQVRIADDTLGYVHRILAEDTTAGRPTLVFRVEVDAPNQQAEQEVSFLVPDFEPVSGRMEARSQGQRLAAELNVVPDRVVGTAFLPDGSTQPLDVRVREPFLLGEMRTLALWLADLEEGDSFQFRTVALESVQEDTVRVRVRGRTEVTVPAGTFEAWELEVSDRRGLETVWVRAEKPHVVLRIEPPPPPPLVTELLTRPDGRDEAPDPEGGGEPPGGR